MWNGIKGFGKIEKNTKCYIFGWLIIIFSDKVQKLDNWMDGGVIFTKSILECQDVVIGPIAKAVNTSLSLDVFPLSMNADLVKPLV